MNKPIEWRLREMYIDFFTKKMDIRIGKQQIIWGQADGVFITDVVTPKDLSEFLLMVRTRVVVHSDDNLDLTEDVLEQMNQAYIAAKAVK